MRRVTAMLLALCALNSIAQTDKAETKAERIGQWRHQVSVGVGLHDMTNWGEHKFRKFEDFHGKTYVWTGLNRTIDVIPSIEYSYRVVGALEIVGALTIERATSNYMNKNTKVIVGDIAMNVYTLGLSARYTWLNTKYFRLYSTLGLSSNFSFRKDNLNGVESNSMRYVPTLAFAPVGVRVGRQLFFFGEIFTYTSRGNLFVAGVGYRF